MAKFRSGARIVLVLATVALFALGSTTVASATIEAKKKPRPKVAATTTTTKPPSQSRTIKGTFSMENGCDYVTSGAKKTWVILGSDDTHPISGINGQFLWIGDEDLLDAWLYGDKSPEDPHLLYPGDTITVTGIVYPPSSGTSCKPYDDEMSVKPGDLKLS